VIEINDSLVQLAGGFPFTISAPGSYRLTSNLDVRAEPTPEDVTAIVIAASDVTLDLNGFEILGPTVCTSSPTVCAPFGSGRGVHASSAFEHVTVRNGTVRGMGGPGIDLGRSSRVADVHVTSNGSYGVQLLQRGYAERVIATLNRSAGIRVRVGGTVARCVSNLNAGDGIWGDGAMIVSGNNTRENDGDGIQVSGGGFADPSLIEGNVSTGNGLYGLNFLGGGGGGYKDNVFEGNGSGTVSSGVIEIGENVCNGNKVCP
jgi:hypothetical protein